MRLFFHRLILNMITEKPYRIAVVGAGHNGLIAGAYLAKAGCNVTIYERNNVIGGCCTSQSLNCGCNLSRGATHFGMLSQRVIDDLNLQFDLKLPEIQSVCLSKKFGVVAIPILTDISDQTCSVSEVDRNSVNQFEAELAASAIDLNEYLHAIDPAAQMLDSTLKMISGSTNSLLSKHLKNPSIKNALIAGSALYPHNIDDAGSAFNLVYLGMHSSDSKPGWSHIRGGMGAITKSIASKFVDMGGRLELSSKVNKVQRNEVTAKVVLRVNDNEEECFDACIAAIDPVQLHTIASSSFLDVDFSKGGWKDENRGVGLKINGILNEKPIPVSALKPFFDRSPETAFIRQESPDTFYNKLYKPDSFLSTPPVWELTFPSLAFENEACSKHETFSIYSNPHPYQDKLDDLDELRDRWSAEIFNSIDEYFPNFSDHIEWCEVLTPNDLEAEFNVTVGNVDHGDMRPTNRLANRSSYLAENHITRHKEILFGASGSMSGGLVTGIPGYRVAKNLLKNLEITI